MTFNLLIVISVTSLFIIGHVSGQTVPPVANTTVPPPPPTAPGGNATAAPPAPGGNATAAPAPGGNATAAPPATGNNSTNPDDIKVGLMRVCLKDINCLVVDSFCGNSFTTDGLLRCRCKGGYYTYQQNNADPVCYKTITSSENPLCGPCESYGGKCLKQSDTNIVCQCPSSQSGTNCEKLHVNIQCANETMTVCYEPQENVKLIADGGDWTMYTLGYSSIPQCVGIAGQNSTTGDCLGYATTLKLSLNAKEINTCGTINSTNSQNNMFSNTIVVSSRNESVSAYVFNVYCSYQMYTTGKYAGIGLVLPNGNDRGVQVSANLFFSIVDEFGRPMVEGATIYVGDHIKFKAALIRDGNYYNFQVLRCTASSSFMMPDSNAETRVLMNNGCPMSGEPTASSWYWSEVPVNDTMYILQTGVVPMFRMTTSDNVYLFCTIKLCLKGNKDECTAKTKESCNSPVRRKRAAVVTTTSVDQTVLVAGLKVLDKDSASSLGSPTVLAVVFSILAAVVIIAIIMGAAILVTKRRKVNDGQERFAMPRLRNTHQRF